MKSEEQIKAAINKLERLSAIIEDDSISAAAVSLLWALDDPICSAGFDIVLDEIDQGLKTCADDLAAKVLSTILKSVH